MSLYIQSEPLPQNPEQLIRPTKIRSRGGFCIGGKSIAAGELVTVTHRRLVVF